MAEVVWRRNQAGDRTWITFSGRDMYCTLAGIPFAEVSAVTVTIAREVIAIFGSGDSNPRAFNRGRRSITGTLVLKSVNRNILVHDLQARQKTAQGFYVTEAAKREIDLTIQSVIALQGTDAGLLLGITPGALDAAIKNLRNIWQTLDRAEVVPYADALPPFNIDIVLMNDEGHASKVSIIGVVILNEGWGWSVEDLDPETTYTFLARAVHPLTPFLGQKQ